VTVRIVGKGGSFHLRLWHEAAGDTDGEILDLRGDPLRAAGIARSLAAVPGAAADLRRLVARTVIGTGRLDDADLLRHLAVELGAGRIVVARVPTPILSTFDVATSEIAPAEPEQPKKQEKTWIEIELLDMAGNPVVGERYWILLPDGTTREGRLDSAGRAYFGDLDPGECDIRFPDLDSDAAGEPAAPVRPKRPRRKTKTWIEVELIGMDDRPIPGELYRIALPDGSKVEGRLDARGRARVHGIDPGTCDVTFPNLDSEAWEVLP